MSLLGVIRKGNYHVAVSELYEMYLDLIKDRIYVVTCLLGIERKGKQRVTVLRCLSCGQTRKLPNNPDHRLWVDQPEALLENQPQQGESPSPCCLPVLIVQLLHYTMGGLCVCVNTRS